MSQTESHSAARTLVQSNEEAVVVSFCAGDRYYYEAADRLVENLKHLDIDHDIQRLHPEYGSTWIDICRNKVRFWRDMLLKHRKPIVWVDVDTKVLRKPYSLLRSSADITCFLRNFKYLVEFDPALYSRLIAPPIIGFNYNSRVLKFLDFAVDIADNAQEPVTDDYCLQEALINWEEDLRIMLLKPSDVVFHNGPTIDDGAYFQHGHSGNVEKFLETAVQHEAAALSISRQKRVLFDSADAALKSGDVDAALVFYKRVRQLDKSDAYAVSKYMELLRRKKEWKKLEYHIGKNKSDPALRHVVQRESFLSSLELGKWKRADKWLYRAKVDHNPYLNLMLSRKARFDLDRRAVESGYSDEERVRMWWMETPYPGNFGDIINPYIIEGLTGVPPKFTHRNPRLLAVGSIIKFARKGTSVWGAGCPSWDQVLSPHASYYAVRGPLTRKKVLECGGTVDEVYGDPAWFLPKIFSPQVKLTHRLGIILHNVHQNEPIEIDDDVRIININRVGYDEIEEFISEMLSCEAVLSTSLHGVIVAHAYGIPVRWCVMSRAAKQIHGDGMKFEDYFLSVGRPAPTPLDLSSIERVSVRLARECVDNPEKAIDLKALADAAPFKMKEATRRLDQVGQNFFRQWRARLRLGSPTIFDDR